MLAILFTKTGVKKMLVSANNAIKMHNREGPSPMYPKRHLINSLSTKPFRQDGWVLASFFSLRGNMDLDSFSIFLLNLHFRVNSLFHHLCS